jgi:hypothetical protein
MKLRTLVFALFLAAGCATSSPFTGPVSDKPTLSVSYMRHVMHTNDFWQVPYVETIATANVTNPSTSETHVTLDCSESLHFLDIAPRTTEHVLLDPKDSSCELR